MFKVVDVTKSYGKGENTFDALSEVTMRIQDGELIAVVGKSGSGKSTLLHLLVGLDEPTSGLISFDDQPLTEINLDNWRGQNIGIVFQQFYLQLNDQVIDNVALPLKIAGFKKKDRQRLALSALKQVGLHDKANSKANDLSGGQKQRVAIARAIVTRPKVLIADEPTGNLDSESGEQVVKTLFALNQKKGTTVIIVTHDEDIAKRCQRIVRLSDGKIVSNRRKVVKG